MSKKKFRDVVGIQVYASKEIDIQMLPNLVGSNSPYVSELTKQTLLDMGVVFFRDSKHGHGAIVCTDFKGLSKYLQFYVDERIGTVGQIFLDNVDREIVEIASGTVKFEMK